MRSACRAGSTISESTSFSPCWITQIEIRSTLQICSQPQPDYPGARQRGGIRVGFQRFHAPALGKLPVYGRLRRVLKPGGRLVFTFLEFAEPAHWGAFKHEVEGRRTSQVVHLNTQIEQPVIDRWYSELGYVRELFVGGSEAPWGASRSDKQRRYCEVRSSATLVGSRFASNGVAGTCLRKAADFRESCRLDKSRKCEQPACYRPRRK
jgi:hypothetical protein